LVEGAGAEAGADITFNNYSASYGGGAKGFSIGPSAFSF